MRGESCCGRLARKKDGGDDRNVAVATTRTEGVSARRQAMYRKIDSSQCFIRSRLGRHDLPHLELVKRRRPYKESVLPVKRPPRSFCASGGIVRRVVVMGVSARVYDDSLTQELKRARTDTQRLTLVHGHRFLPGRHLASR